MRPGRSAASAAAAALVLVAAGCGEDAAQQAAREAVQAHVGGRPRCTQTARQYLQLVPTRLYLCIVRREDGRCDEYAAIRRGHTFEVRQRRRGVDCMLPVG